ncbi:hypothetical protein FQA39_LY19108 [Lamprigera yunnana]|nr:hypothetical protein FQA39_LY19108 [Lamprigera yunnana]
MSAGEVRARQASTSPLDLAQSHGAAKIMPSDRDGEGEDDWPACACPVVLTPLTCARWALQERASAAPTAHPAVLRPVSSEDAMTADWTRVPLRGARPHLEPNHDQVPEVDIAFDARHHLDSRRERLSGSRGSRQGSNIARGPAQCAGGPSCDELRVEAWRLVPARIREDAAGSSDVESQHQRSPLMPECSDQAQLFGETRLLYPVLDQLEVH